MAWRKVSENDATPGVTLRARNHYENAEFDVTYVSDGDGVHAGFVLAGAPHIYVLVHEVREVQEVSK